MVADGELWAFIIAASPKCADLRRDGRFALHSFPPEEVDDEFLVQGTAHEAHDIAPDDERWARICNATEAQVGVAGETLFRLDIASAMVATYAARGVFPPAYRVWQA